MPVVTGQVMDPLSEGLPGGVGFYLAGGPDLRPLPQAWGPDGEIFTGFAHTDIDEHGFYSADLFSNELLTPEDTRWVRYLATRNSNDATAIPLFVPSGAGPYNENDVIDQGMGELMAGALGAHAGNTSEHGKGRKISEGLIVVDTSVTGTALTLIPGFAAALPAGIPHPVRIRAHLRVNAVDATNASSNFALCIVPTDDVNALLSLDVQPLTGIDTDAAAPNGVPGGYVFKLEADLPANSPARSYGVAFQRDSGTATGLKVKATAISKCRITIHTE